MSRSIKRAFIVSKTKACSFFKRQAAKRTRKALDIGNGCEYKKYGEPYNICDAKVYSKGYTYK